MRSRSLVPDILQILHDMNAAMYPISKCFLHLNTFTRLMLRSPNTWSVSWFPEWHLHRQTAFAPYIVENSVLDRVVCGILRNFPRSVGPLGIFWHTADFASFHWLRTTYWISVKPVRTASIVVVSYFLKPNFVNISSHTIITYYHEMLTIVHVFSCLF